MPIILTTWHPAKYVPSSLTQRSEKPDHEPFGVIILNQVFDSIPLVINAIDRCECFVCADGGANRLLDLYEGSVASGLRKWENLRMPAAICGDLDSIQPATRAFFSDKGVRIIEDKDQYATDLKKSLRFVNEYMTSCAGTWDLLVFGGLSGRADQAFSQLHHLYAIDADPSLKHKGQTYLITTDSVLFLLKRGLNRIHSPVEGRSFTENVGIIPLGNPANVTTRGLEWDVVDWRTSFDTQVSTSNHIRRDVVEVETTEAVLFTMEFGASTKR